MPPRPLSTLPRRLPGCALLLWLTATAPSAPPAVCSGDESPLVVVWHDSGNLPYAPRGLAIAVWADGALLIAADPAYPGRQVLRGRCAAADVAQLVDAIRAAGFSDLPRDWVVPCANTVTIRVCVDGKAVRRVWHESLQPGFGGDINTDAAYRDFVRAWRKVHGAIESLAPLEVELVDPERGPAPFRGYDFRAPHETPWIRA